MYRYFQAAWEDVRWIQIGQLRIASQPCKRIIHVLFFEPNRTAFSTLQLLSAEIY
jgi:hypothetical protein